MIASLVRGIQLSRRSVLRIDEMRKTKVKLEDEKAKLVEEGKYVESPNYLEKVAREELHLSKPGETIVIVPKSNLTENYSNGKINLEKDKERKSNWVQWWEILTGAN